MRNTKQGGLVAVLLAAFGAMVSGCSAIAGIFKAGAWTGAILVIAIVAVVGGAFAVMRR